MKLAEHIAVEDLMALGNFLLLPEDDFSLACILKSPLYNVSEEPLFGLCYNREGQSLWQRLKEYSGSDASCISARDELASLLAETDFRLPSALYADILYVRGAKKRFVERMGGEAIEPLEAFLAEIHHYEEAHTPTLQGFLHWMERGEKDIKRDMEQGLDAVRIMTVHGAKGLQAPIVLLPDTTTIPTMKDSLLESGNDDTPQVFFCPRKDDAPQQLRQWREREKECAMDEYRRLLYVAMTRAEDELYVTGYHTREKLPEECWYEMARRGFERLEAGEVSFEEAYPDIAPWSGDAEMPLLYYRNEGTGVTEAPLPSSLLRGEGSLPHHLTQPLPPEKAPAKPLSPSHLTEDTPGGRASANIFLPHERGSAERGTLIHRLFHILPGVPGDQREAVARGFSGRYAADWPEASRRDMVEEVLRVMRHTDFAEVFGPGGMEEVPVCGTVDDTTWSGQIDRLIVTAHEVLIVDFKTGTLPEDGTIPQEYTKQMEAYRALLSSIYPQKTIRCALLFTAGPAIITLPQDSVVAQKPYLSFFGT